MSIENVKYTKVWKVNGHLVIAEEPEDAIKLYREARRQYDSYAPNICNVQVVYGDLNNNMAILSVEKDEEDNKDDKGRITG